MPRLAAFAFLLCSCLQAATAALPPAVEERLREAGIPVDAVGVWVRRLPDEATVLAHNAERAMQPASTLKLLTAIVALERLGPAYRGAAELRSTGEIDREVLRGDLVLRGLGNVDLDWQALERMLQLLRLRGVREIGGDLVLDMSFFKPTRNDLGVAPFDEAPEFRYNVIPDALLLNTYLVRLDMLADARGVRVATTPPLEKVSFGSEMKLGRRNCEDWELGWILPGVRQRRDGTIMVRLQGEFPRDCTATTSISVIDRMAFVDRLFRALWQRLGGTITGTTREGTMGADARLLAEHRSRTLGEIVRDVNKRSDNPVTRVVFLTLGALSSVPSDDSTARRADAEVRAWLAARGIDHRGIVLENGSGLSRTERISAAQLGAVLRHASASEWAPEFLASLPIAAVDGGMRKRLAQSPAAAQARIKTGTLRDVTAVAGYVRDEAGRNHVVVAMINHPLATRHVARPALDALIDWVARMRPEAAASRR